MSRRKEYNYFEIDEDQVKSVKTLCPRNSYRIVEPDTVKQLKILPEDLVNKYVSVLIVSSGSSDSDMAYMLNGNRVEQKPLEIDQMPFGFICSGSTPLTSGSLIQHGDWSSRTITPPDSFWDTISHSGINTLYPISEMPSESSGSLDQLKIDSQMSAFTDLVIELRKSLHEE